MKKIMILARSLGTAFFASAQGTREMEDVKDIILGPRKSSGDSRTSDKDIILGRDDRKVYEDDRRNYPTGTSRSSEANRINREYDAKIASIRNSRHLSRAEKERAIRQLEADRNRKIRNLNDRNYNDSRRYDDDNDRRYDYSKNKNNKKYKKNNGKHLGWEEGKGRN